MESTIAQTENLAPPDSSLNSRYNSIFQFIDIIVKTNRNVNSANRFSLKLIVVNDR